MAAAAGPSIRHRYNTYINHEKTPSDDNRYKLEAHNSEYFKAGYNFFDSFESEVADRIMDNIRTYLESINCKINGMDPYVEGLSSGTDKLIYIYPYGKDKRGKYSFTSDRIGAGHIIEDLHVTFHSVADPEKYGSLEGRFHLKCTFDDKYTFIRFIPYLESSVLKFSFVVSNNLKPGDYGPPDRHNLSVRNFFYGLAKAIITGIETEGATIIPTGDTSGHGSPTSRSMAAVPITGVGAGHRTRAGQSAIAEAAGIVDIEEYQAQLNAAAAEERRKAAEAAAAEERRKATEDERVRIAEERIRAAAEAKEAENIALAKKEEKREELLEALRVAADGDEDYPPVTGGAAAAAAVSYKSDKHVEAQIKYIRFLIAHGELSVDDRETLNKTAEYNGRTYIYFYTKKSGIRKIIYKGKIQNVDLIIPSKKRNPYTLTLRGGRRTRRHRKNQRKTRRYRR